MPLAKICQTCQGCGRTPLDSSEGWAKCWKCDGIGVVSIVENGKFANGLGVNEYLKTRLGDM